MFSPLQLISAGNVRGNQAVGGMQQLTKSKPCRLQYDSASTKSNEQTIGRYNQEMKNAKDNSDLPPKTKSR